MAVAQPMDGKALAAEVRQQLAAAVERLPAPPGLAVILVGSRTDAKAYMTRLTKLCNAVGVTASSTELSDTAVEADVLAAVAAANEDAAVHGVLLQLPLPKHMDEQRVLASIEPAKDVDCLHPVSFGRLALSGHEPAAPPSVAAGCLALLDRAGVPLKGRRATVIGRSNLVGLPAALMLQQRGATVTVCHAETPAKETMVAAQGADILVVAAGRPGLVKASWVKPGAAVCDVGLTTVEDAEAAAGYRMVGDCEPEVAEVAGFLSPVPGGVAALTVAMLLKNVVSLAKDSLAKAPPAAALPTPAEAET